MAVGTPSSACCRIEPSSRLMLARASSLVVHALASFYIFVAPTVARHLAGASHPRLPAFAATRDCACACHPRRYSDIRIRTPDACSGFYLTHVAHVPHRDLEPASVPAIAHAARPLQLPLRRPPLAASSTTSNSNLTSTSSSGGRCSGRFLGLGMESHEKERWGARGTDEAGEAASMLPSAGHGSSSSAHGHGGVWVGERYTSAPAHDQPPRAHGPLGFAHLSSNTSDLSLGATISGALSTSTGRRRRPPSARMRAEQDELAGEGGDLPPRRGRVGGVAVAFSSYT
ncbi:hypothetical protein B0H17DRAFT_1223113 [Mycena rosella]|uniref:Uncharacterized protein n=1 Tax=Mycena rosella TaxID=1033263 RepID=A0AAD7AWF7_MYCRO|nr:hypothetical protein B0H17DRAFT_1223113 [Mycena rosella]